jgi:8-oxo-dGTP pyrophosphatase MutT (NUDIX family)
MLVRPAGAKGLEVFMLRRSEASHFVPDVYVFPGGTLDSDDYSQRALARARGVDDDNVRRQFRAQPAPSFPAPFGSPPRLQAAGLLVAAVRELFEEAGVLLACDEHGNALSDNDLAPHRSRLNQARAAVQNGSLAFHELLAEIGVYANAAALSLFSHWITPPAFARRYDAHFFLAQASANQAAAADAFETHDGVWIAPQNALEQCVAGTFRMVYPTIKHVERLARFAGIEELFGFAQSKRIYSIMPDTPADREFSMPPELEYAW